MARVVLRTRIRDVKTTECFIARLGEGEAKAFIESCQREIILPEDWLRHAAGLNIREPFVVPAPPKWITTETGRMLSILTSLWTKAPDSFAAAAKGVGGHRRLWFSTDSNEIWRTGSSNKSEKIGDSPWWVSTNCPWNGMTARIKKVMGKMGFSSRYATVVSWAVVDGVGRISVSDYLK